jgi:hypothetical protein
VWQKSRAEAWLFCFALHAYMVEWIYEKSSNKDECKFEARAWRNYGIFIATAGVLAREK